MVFFLFIALAGALEFTLPEEACLPASLVDVQLTDLEDDALCQWEGEMDIEASEDGHAATLVCLPCTKDFSTQGFSFSVQCTDTEGDPVTASGELATNCRETDTANDVVKGCSSGGESGGAAGLGIGLAWLALLGLLRHRQDP